ncbi:sensor domain-containing diguanylate cyclase [Aureimonas sp. Leaf454]|uniref:GGDEF domain-containing protein n=1 Tax=Aureimonas sp. Leaf454 TaxID=1736381 RepID=UPI0012E3B635|nr:sensor domain-containing diguanylate cyclase [Aureimonas sp. Leaf454]
MSTRLASASLPLPPPEIFWDTNRRSWSAAGPSTWPIPTTGPCSKPCFRYWPPGEAAEPVQYRARRKDGVYRWIEATGRPLGPELGYILALRDIERRKQAEDELGAAVLRLNELANSDGMTGLANRRRFDDSLEREISRAARSGAPISLLLADVDHFKTFNDTYGHPAGDACLRSVADILARTVRRPGDVAARYGGEEFAAILPETDTAGAFALAQSFRSAVAAASLEHVRSGFGVVTISVGVVTLVPDPGVTTPSDMIRSADSALYRAKGSGRNRVVRFDLEEAMLPKQVESKLNAWPRAASLGDTSLPRLTSFGGNWLQPGSRALLTAAGSAGLPAGWPRSRVP